jgi:hypothetical protein
VSWEWSEEVLRCEVERRGMADRWDIALRAGGAVRLVSRGA